LNVLKGIYVLIIQVSSDVVVQVGALGKLTFKKGVYAYVGSAQNNLEKRVRRHLRKEKRKFWHIDYLLDNDAAKVIAVFHKQVDKAEECVVAKTIGERDEAVAGFGSSDCNCKSHLYRIEDYGFLQEFMCVNVFSSFYLSSSGRP
jgi:Uri superfamily endonuclease